ncbi:MAG: HugZ family protein [Kiloniellaceae bacterium]
MNTAPRAPGAQARALLRRAERAGLGTVLAESQGGGPYVSLVLTAFDYAAAPLLMLSDLADHAKNLAAEPRASLLIDATAGWKDPLAGPRVSLVGRIAAREDAGLQARFTARHPNAAIYADFTDFRLYGMAVERARLVAGFGKIHWIEARELLFDARDTAALAAAESAILADMNDNHADAVQLIAQQNLGQSGDGWRLVGVDPEGADLRAADGLARVDFARPVRSAEDARAALSRLAEGRRDLHH